jgi:branched-chain amino acid transport system permease protein
MSSAGISGAPAKRVSLAGRFARRRAALAGVWLLLALWPLVSPNDYIAGLGITFLINVLLIASLNLVIGCTGQISLAHGAFFGLGAYTSGILSVRLGWNAFAGLGAAALMSGLTAMLLAGPTLRLRGHYLAMGTLGFNAILSVLFVELVPLTGGPNGLSGVPSFQLGSWSFDTPMRFYALCWVLSLVLMLLMLNLLSSSLGRAARAIAQGELAADAIGINPFAIKAGMFVVSAAVAGAAGSLYVHFNQFASPDTFSFFTSLLLVVMVALGGWGSFFGPLAGALIYTGVPELLRRFEDAELLFFGLCMLGVLLYAPGGLAGLARRLPRPWRRG